jgi:hypothetical protein
MKFLRRAQVAERYGVNVRTLERMCADGRLPKPHYRGRMPLWSEVELDSSDRAAAAAPRPRPRTPKSGEAVTP